MKSNNDMLVTFTDFVRRIYNQHIPKQSTTHISSMGDYIKNLKQQLELIEAEIASEKNRLLNEASSNPTINVDLLSHEFFNIVEAQHIEWMNAHMPR